MPNSHPAVPLEKTLHLQPLAEPRVSAHLPHFSLSEDQLLESFANLAIQSFEPVQTWLFASHLTLHTAASPDASAGYTHISFAAQPQVVRLITAFAETKLDAGASTEHGPIWLPSGLLQQYEDSRAPLLLGVPIWGRAELYGWLVMCFSEAPAPNLTHFSTAAQLLSQRLAYALLSRQYIAAQEATLMQQAEEIAAQLDLVESERNNAARKLADLDDSIHYASRIQRTLLQAPESLAQLFPAGSRVLYKPKDTLSGDFYWWTRRADCAVVVLADCTGHGVPGAMLSFLGINLLNQLALELTDFNPGQMLSLLNFRLACALQPDDATHKLYDGMDVAILTLNLQTGIARFSGANIGLYVMQGTNVSYLEPTKLPLAGQELPNEDNLLLREYETVALKFNPGDRFVMSSDGVKDQIGHDDTGRTKRLGRRAFHDFLVANAHLSFAKMDVLFQRLMSQWTAGEAQTDDMLVVGAEFQPHS
jgi:serine phosphatase RsbU (regulator of sigma subunit)